MTWGGLGFQVKNNQLHSPTQENGEIFLEVSCWLKSQFSQKIVDNFYFALEQIF